LDSRRDTVVVVVVVEVTVLTEDAAVAREDQTGEGTVFCLG
jgi:hypothetical protein